MRMKRAISLLLSLVLALGLILIKAPVVYADDPPAESTPSEENPPATGMAISDAGIAYLKSEEGFSKYPYEDYGQMTVGYGTKCPSDMLEEYKKNGISEEAAEVLLRNHLSGIEVTLNKKLIDKYELELTQNQYDALVSFTYNLGTAWIYKTDSLFFKAVVEGGQTGDVIRAFSLYCNAGGKALSGLVRRRLCEANIYLNAEYSRTRPSKFGYVYLNENGGTGCHSVQGYYTDDTPAVLETPTYADHTFLGWYTDKTGGTKVETLTKELVGKTIYARWESNNPEENKPEDTDKPSSVVVTVTANDVNLRGGAGTNYTIVGSANKGNQLTITETASGSGLQWGKSDKGWIALKYTDYDVVTGASKPTEPEATKPTEPEATKPTEPEATKPTEPEATKPTEPEATKPTEPEATKPTEPEETKPADKKVTGTIKVNGSLNVRKGPGTGYGIAGYLSNGSKVTIEEQKTVGHMVWGKIDFGWISMSYVTLDKAESNSGSTSSSTTTDKTPAQEDKVIATGKISGTNTLRIRKGAGTSYAVAGYLSKGSKVQILETKKVGSVNWGRVSKGWISMSYVTLDKAETEKEEKPAETITGKIKVSNKLKIRKGAGSSYASVGTYKNGTKVTIQQTKKVGSTTWGKTDKGWISMKYVVLDKPESTGSSTTANIKTITASSLRVRKTASSTAKVVDYLYKGEKVEILSTKKVGSTTWGKIATGWISMKYTK